MSLYDGSKEVENGEDFAGLQFAYRPTCSTTAALVALDHHVHRRTLVLALGGGYGERGSASI